MDDHSQILTPEKIFARDADKHLQRTWPPLNQTLEVLDGYEQKPMFTPDPADAHHPEHT
jgi:hypothetical protein